MKIRAGLNDGNQKALYPIEFHSQLFFPNCTAFESQMFMQILVSNGTDLDPVFPTNLFKDSLTFSSM